MHRLAFPFGTDVCRRSWALSVERMMLAKADSEDRMGKSWCVGVLVCSVLVVATPSRSDVSPPVATTTGTVPPSAAVPEPITGTPSTPAPGSETAPRDPFTPYAIGPTPGDKSPKPFWSYADLSAADKVVADRNKDAQGWDQINGAFASASAGRARQAAADSAQAQLGVSDLGTTGVIP